MDRGARTEKIFLKIKIAVHGNMIGVAYPYAWHLHMQIMCICKA
jgi:hypothetical protein